MALNKSEFSVGDQVFIIATLVDTGLRTIRKAKVIAAEYDLTNWQYTINTVKDNFTFKLVEADIFATLEDAKGNLSVTIRAEVMAKQAEMVSVQELTIELV